VLLYFVLGYTTDEQQHQQAATIGAIKYHLDGEAASDDRFVRGVRLIVARLDVQIRNEPSQSPPVPSSD